MRPRPVAQDRFLRKHGGLLHISEDDRLVACAAGSEAVILDVGGNELTSLPRKHAGVHPWSIAISIKAGMVAAGYDDGAVCVWSLEDEQILAQGRLAPSTIYGIAFAGVIAQRRKQQTQLAVTAGQNVLVVRAKDLHVLGALPCDTPRPSLSNPLFKSVAATNDGRFVAGGRFNGQVYIWQCNERGSYQLMHSLSFPGEILRLLLSDPSVYASQLTGLYVARYTAGSLPAGWDGGEACEISSWDFSARAMPSQVAKIPAADLTDIAVGRDGTVLSSHRYQYARRAILDHRRIVKGAVESNGLPPIRERVPFFEQTEPGILSVAGTQDLRVAFARDDDGRVTAIKPIS
jgi:hypothetical protein